LLAALATISVLIEPAAGAGSPASGSLKYPFLQFQVPSASQDGLGVTSGVAPCPKGHPNVTGGGIELGGDQSGLDLEVHTTGPLGRGSWAGLANNSSTSTASAKVTAICAKGDPRKFIHRQETIAVAPKTEGVGTVTCPHRTKVTGGGVFTSGTSFKVEVAETGPIDIGDINSLPDNGWGGVANNGSTSAATMDVIAICAKSGTYRYVESDEVTLQDNSVVSTLANCPARTQVTGGGVDVFGFNDGFEVESSVPIDSRDAGAKPDDGWLGTANNDNSGQAANTRTFAICRKVG